MAKGSSRRKKRHKQRVTSNPSAESLDTTEDTSTGADASQALGEQLFAQLRSGAANVAGITFQILVSAYLLVEGRASAGSDDDVVSVLPEGFEDIDCRLRTGETVQSRKVLLIR